MRSTVRRKLVRLEGKLGDGQRGRDQEDDDRTSGMAARLGRRTFRLGDRIGLRTAQPGLSPAMVTLL